MDFNVRMKVAARINIPRAKKLNAVPVLLIIVVNEPEMRDVVMLGIEVSIWETTISPTIIVTAAMTTVRISPTISTCALSFRINICVCHLRHCTYMYVGLYILYHISTILYKKVR